MCTQPVQSLLLHGVFQNGYSFGFYKKCEILTPVEQTCTCQAVAAVKCKLLFYDRVEKGVTTCSLLTTTQGGAKVTFYYNQHTLTSSVS